MQHIKKIARRVIQGWHSINQGSGCNQLDKMIFASGLGDSAWILYGLVRSAKPKVVVEIGSAQGKSACYIGMALKDNGGGKLYAIDPHTQTKWNDEGSIDTYNTIFRNLKSLGVQDYVEVKRAFSEEIAQNWNLKIDILFIDGDHSYSGVKRDWELFSPFVRPFGSIIFHDTLWGLKPDPRYSRQDMGVPQLVEELRQQGYPVITVDRDFGVSIVQPVLHGISLQPISESTV